MKQERAGPPLTERFQLMLSKSEISAIDRWRYAQHIPSRADAIRRLVAKGLGAGSVEKRT